MVPEPESATKKRFPVAVESQTRWKAQPRGKRRLHPCGRDSMNGAAAKIRHKEIAIVSENQAGGVTQSGCEIGSGPI